MRLDNLLLTALEIIPKQDVSFQKFLGNLPNVNGIEAPTYGDMVNTIGSVQKVSGGVKYQLGLSLQENYRHVWLPNDVYGIDGDVSNDIVWYKGKKWNVVQQDDWFDYDGWVGLIVCEDKSYAFQDRE